MYPRGTCKLSISWFVASDPRSACLYPRSNTLRSEIASVANGLKLILVQSRWIWTRARAAIARVLGWSRRVKKMERVREGDGWERSEYSLVASLLLGIFGKLSCFRLNWDRELNRFQPKVTSVAFSEQVLRLGGTDWIRQKKIVHRPKVQLDPWHKPNLSFSKSWCINSCANWDATSPKTHVTSCLHDDHSNYHCALHHAWLPSFAPSGHH